MTAASNKVLSATWSYDPVADKTTLTSGDQVSRLDWTAGGKLTLTSAIPLDPTDTVTVGPGQGSNAPGNLGVSLRALISGPNSIEISPQTATGPCKAGGSIYVVRNDTKFAIDVPGGPPAPPAVSGSSATGVIYRPGAPTAAPFYATPAEVKAAVDAAGGDLLLEVDDSIVTPAPWNINMDGRQRLVLGGARFSTSGTGPILEIADGFTISNIRTIADSLTVECDSHSAPGIDQANGALLFITRGGKVQNSPTATRPGVRFPVGGGVISDLANPSLDPNGSGQAVVELVGPNQLILGALNQFPGGPPNNFDNTIAASDPGATLIFVHDSSTSQLPTLPAFLGTIGGALSLENALATNYDDSAHAPDLCSPETVTANYVQPAVWTAVTVALTSSQKVTAGDLVKVATGGTYLVASTPSPTSAKLVLVPVPGNAPPGATITAPQAIDTENGPSVQNAIDALKGSAVYGRGSLAGPSGAPYSNAGAAFTPILSLPFTSPITGFLCVRAVVNASTQGTPQADGSGAAFGVSLDGGPHAVPQSRTGSAAAPVIGCATLLARIPVTPGAHTLTLDGQYIGTSANPGDGVTVGLQLAALTYEITAS